MTPELNRIYVGLTIEPMFNNIYPCEIQTGRGWQQPWMEKVLSTAFRVVRLEFPFAIHIEALSKTVNESWELIPTSTLEINTSEGEKRCLSSVFIQSLKFFEWLKGFFRTSLLKKTKLLKPFEMCLAVATIVQVLALNAAQNTIVTTSARNTTTKHTDEKSTNATGSNTLGHLIHCSGGSVSATLQDNG